MYQTISCASLAGLNGREVYAFVRFYSYLRTSFDRETKIFNSSTKRRGGESWRDFWRVSHFSLLFLVDSYFTSPVDRPEKAGMTCRADPWFTSVFAFKSSRINCKGIVPTSSREQGWYSMLLPLMWAGLGWALTWHHMWVEFVFLSRYGVDEEQTVQKV